MIKDKISGNVISSNTTNSQYKATVSEDPEVITDYAEMPDNSVIDVHNAIKEILQNTRWKYNDKKSENIFRTVKYNAGQYEYIVTGDSNPMAEMAFPAALISFINMRWISGQNTICEGTAELRIQILMNTLNNLDDDKETEMYYVAQRVIQTIQEEKYNYPALLKQCKLEFMDTATSYHSGLQSLWLTYSIKFTEISVWVERKTVRRYIVTPPFTNHSDQSDSTMNVLGHTNSNHTVTYDEATKFVEKLED